MSSDYDITMSVDDTLELDTIIEEWDASKSIDISDSSDYNLTGIQTKTGIFDPNVAREYNMNINGQNLKINVRDNGSSGIVDDFSSNDLSNYTISGPASIVENSGTVYNKYGLSCDSSNTKLYSNFGNGLDYYPSSEDTIFVLIQDPSSSPNPYVLFNQKDGYGYRVSFQGGGGASLSIYKETNSGTSTISSTGVSLNYTTWYWLVLYPPTNQDTTIKAEFRSADTNAISNGDLASSVGSVLHSTSGSDSTFVDQSGIGFGTAAGNGSGLTVDLMTVNLI